MGLGTWFAQRNGIAVPPPVAAPETEQRQLVSIADPAVIAMLGGDPTGITVSETTAMNLSGVFRAVSLIAGAVGSLPLRTLETGDDGQSTRVRSFLNNPGGQRFTPAEWAELVMVHLLLHGNAYLQHIYAANDHLVGLYPIHPASVSVEWDEGRPGGRRYQVTVLERPNAAPKTHTFDASTMTHIMGPTLDGLVGISAIHAGRLSLGTGISGEKAANRQFRNGAMISGLVTPSDKDEDMTPDQADAVRDALRQHVTGPENSGRVAVLSKALSFQSWQMTATDAQFLESRKFSVEEISRWFGVPVHLLSRTDADSNWGTGIAEQNRGLARYTLQPWTNRIEQRVSRLLPSTRKAEFDYAQFVRPSPEDEIQLLIAQAGGPFLTVNEARAIRNLPPVADGDVIRTPVGGTPTDGPDEPAADPGERP